MSDTIKNAFGKEIDGSEVSFCQIILKYLIFPILGCGFICYILYFSSLDIDWENMAVNILTCISIFTAFIFTIIFFAPEHLLHKKEEMVNLANDSKKNYFTRYINLTKITISRLSVTTYISFIYIFFLLLQLIVSDKYLIIMNTFIFIFVCELIICSLKDILLFLNDDIEQVAKTE